MLQNYQKKLQKSMINLKKSEKQEKNWVKLEDLQKCIDINKTNFENAVKNNMKQSVIVKEMNKYICSLFYSGKYQAPIRLELCETQLLNKTEYKNLEQKTGAYLVGLNTKSPMLHLHNFKTRNNKNNAGL